MKKTLVFGASVRPYRYSNLAMRRLIENGIEIMAFGLREGVVNGVPIQTSLDGITDIHTISLYMNPRRQRPFYGAMVALAPQRVIFNPGTENPEFYEILSREGIEVCVACTLVLLAIGKY